jgi:pimeloyl-ACP methyl ester carboxylesterase
MEALKDDRRPARVLWADSDPALPLEPIGRLVEGLFPGSEGLTVITDAGHYLQEDQGARIGELIVDFLGARSSSP